METYLNNIKNEIISHIKGEIEKTYCYLKPLDMESNDVPLLELNESGFITFCSQPGILLSGNFTINRKIHGDGIIQRPFIEGWVSKLKYNQIKDKIKYNIKEIIYSKDKCIDYIEASGLLLENNDVHYFTHIPCISKRILGLNEEKIYNKFGIKNIDEFNNYILENYIHIVIYGEFPKTYDDEGYLFLEEHNKDFWNNLLDVFSN
jgi:hypothetical protein